MVSRTQTRLYHRHSCLWPVAQRGTEEKLSARLEGERPREPNASTGTAGLRTCRLRPAGRMTRDKRPTTRDARGHRVRTLPQRQGAPPELAKQKTQENAHLEGERLREPNADPIVSQAFLPVAQRGAEEKPPEAAKKKVLENAHLEGERPREPNAGFAPCGSRGRSPSIKKP